MASAERGAALTAFAAAFGLLAVSNILKPFQFGGDQTGFVLFGTRLDPAGSAIAGPLFGLFLFAYAASIWRMRRSALPMAYAYAAYVVLNLVLFSIITPTPQTIGYMLFGIGYSVVAIGVSVAAVVALTRRKQDLR